MLRRTIISLVALTLASSLAVAGEVSGYLVGTTDYVYRGVTQSDGHAALQGGLDVGFESGFFLGAWASSVDIEGPGTNSRDFELRAYLGYGFDINEQLRLVVSAVAYRYPGEQGPFDYDNYEASLSLGIADRFWIEYAFSPDLYTTGLDTHNIEAFTEWPVGRNYLASVGIGYFEIDSRSTMYENKTHYWQFGLTRSFASFDLDLRYHEADEAVWLTSTSDRTGSRVALSIRFSF